MKVSAWGNERIPAVGSLLNRKRKPLISQEISGFMVAETGLELTSRFFWYVLHRPLFPVFNRSMVLCGFFNFQSGTA